MKKSKNITRKPKRVDVTHIHIATKTYYSSYECPSCKVSFVGASISKQVLRFSCDCGQELIIDKHLIEDD